MQILAVPTPGLRARRIAQAGIKIKERWSLKSVLITAISSSSMKTIANRHRHAA